MVVVVFGEVKWLGDFVLRDQGLGIAEVPFWFPSVLSCGVSLPPDQESVVTGLSSVSEDHFNFILLFAIY